MATQEKTTGPTPNGGNYSIAYFRDKKGNPTEKKNAVGAEIVEYKNDGEVVGRTYGTINRT